MIRGGGALTIVGRVESVWRYPVKSMRGEELREAFVGFAGIYGDRMYAFRSSAAHKGFPFLTAREQGAMLLCRATYRDSAAAAQPANLAEAEALGPGVTPVYADSSEMMVDVTSPDGEQFAIDDPGLVEFLRRGLGERHELTLMRSERAITDCRPVSLFSIQTARYLGDEVGAILDKRRFRANVYLDLDSGAGFGEDAFVGRRLRIGAKTTIAVMERDPRCKMITLDPDSAEPNPEVIKRLAHGHDGNAGVYGAVLVEGTIRPGDDVALLD